MKIRTQNYNNVTVVELQGELDCDSAAAFKSTVTDMVAKHKNGIAIDMSNIEFIDSEGLEILLWARDYCNENNCPLRLTALNENCAKILEITRLDNEFNQYEELAEAVKSFA